jgi:hypothetical protein
VIIPRSVSSIGASAFGFCSSLSTISVDALNLFFSSIDGVLFDKSQTRLIQCPGGKTGTYTVPNGVTNVQDSAFASCVNLTRVILPESVVAIGAECFSSCTRLISITFGSRLASIGDYAFYYCPNLTSLYFKGNAPSIGSNLFGNTEKAIVYYLPGTTDWESSFGDRPAVLWNSQIQKNDQAFGVRTNCFGFTMTGTSNLVIVVEACTNLCDPAWCPLRTNTLTEGSLYFSDPGWTNYPGRFYRLRAP